MRRRKLYRKIKHWLPIILATAAGVFLPLFYYRGTEIVDLLVGRDSKAELNLKNWFVSGTYIAPPFTNTLTYSSSTGRYYRSGKHREPKISASAYRVSDLDTGQTIMEKNPGVIYPIASITKLMTSVVSLENINQNQMAQVSGSAMNAFGHAGQLKEGEKFKVGDLLYPLLLESSNKTAEVIAETGGRSRFLDRMNAKADTLGMKDTFYEDPSGLSPHNVSTANDLSRLAKYIYSNHPEVLNITLEKKHRGYGRIWYNKNGVVQMSNYLGGKDGFTEEAKKTVISIFSLPLSDYQDRRVVIVLLHSKDKIKDVQNILKYLNSDVSYSG